jgi:hypothetical protein
MDFPLYSDVILLVDVPEEGLVIGDIGTIVDAHHVPELETGYTLEFFDLLGNTVAVVTLAASALRAPTAADRPMARHLVTSAPSAS